MQSSVGAENEDVKRVYKAIQQSERLSFAYRDAEGVESARTVEPIRLLWEQSAWYLEAYCLLRQANRLIRVTRVSKLDFTGQCFVPGSSDSAAERRMEGEALAVKRGVTAHLRFDRSARARVIEQFKEACTHHDSYTDVIAVFYTMDYALSVILSYGSQVIVLSPDGLKQKLMLEMLAMQRRYS